MKKSSSRKSESEMLASIGIDLADLWSDWVSLDRGGEVTGRGRVRTSEVKLTERFGSMPPAVVAIEVGTHSAWVSRVLRRCGHRVVVANARKVSLIHQNRRKNNRIDAEFLARLVRVDEKLLFPIDHRGESAQRDLSMLRSRDVLVRTRTTLINHVRGVCKAFGMPLPSCSAESFALRYRSARPELLAEVIDAVVEQIQRLTDQIRTYDRQVEKMVTRYGAAQRLRQITGVGPLTALAYVLTVEDPRRITRSRSAGAFFGLVPGSDDSGEDHEQQRITKEGDRFCRRLLVSAGQYILGPFGPDCDLRRHGLAISARGGKNAKKRAVVAVARKLAVLMHRLWISQADYVPLFNAALRSTAA
jgi:transposase